MTNTASSTTSPLTVKLKVDAEKIFLTGVGAADPYKAVKRCLKLHKQCLGILLDLNNPDLKRTGSWKKIHLIAFGKAACAMSQAAQELIPADLLAGKGIAVTNYDNVQAIDHFEVQGAGHPLPDQAGFAAAKIVAKHAARARQYELVLVLVSGGGSALIPYPIDAITLEEKIATTELLLACGADIKQINCVRKHLSQLKGGGMARKVFPADLHALILSDVIGDDISAIASGPTVADDSNFQEAVEILIDKGIWHKIPAKVANVLEQGRLGLLPETPKKGDRIFSSTSHTLIGSNAVSIKACLDAAQDLGYTTLLYSDKLSGEARAEAEKLLKYAEQIISQGFEKPLAILAGGETTVTLKGDGRGGRNQEMALAFAVAAAKHKFGYAWTFLSGGTDGRDGPTDAAGGIVNAGSIKRMQMRNIDPVALLENNDSYTALKAARDLLVTGATGTNVADLQVMLIHPQS
jgi:glycerate 2-kinase